MKQTIIIYLIPELLSQVKGKVKSKPKIALLNSMDPQQLRYTERLHYREIELSLCALEKNQAKKTNSTN